MSNEIIENYEKVARKVLIKDYKTFLIGQELPVMEHMGLQHLIKIGASVMLTRDKILMGGGFVNSIVNNDLDQAISRADNISYSGLRYFLYLKKYVNFDENGKQV